MNHFATNEKAKQKINSIGALFFSDIVLLHAWLDMCVKANKNKALWSSNISITRITFPTSFLYHSLFQPPML